MNVVAKWRYHAAFRIGVALGFITYPVFEARQWVYRTFLRDAWLARNRRLKNNAGGLLDALDRWEGPRESETWPDFFERLSRERRES